MLPRGRPRYIPEDAEIHPSVFELMRDLRPPYQPPNLPAGRLGDTS
jgi:hypothetical protein